MGKTKITNRQLCFITFGLSLGGSVLVVSALMASIEKQDAWLGAIATAVFGFPVIWILIFLRRRFPDKNSFSRAFEIFILISASLFLIATVLILPNAKIENLQPVLENGLSAVFKSAFFMSAFVTYPVYTLMMVYPTHTSDLKAAGKSMLTGYLFSSVISFLAIILSILVLGWQITANTRYPAFRLAKEIEMGVVFTRIEFIIFFSWILTQFIINTLLFYAAVKGIAQLFGINDHKKIILPFALVVFVLSGVVFPDVFYQENWIVFV